MEDYYRSGKLPTDIPTTPRKTYKDKGWVGMGDWLGTGRGNQHRPFNEARLYSRKLA